jgi:limonene 1,2-monooxygenase
MKRLRSGIFLAPFHAIIEDVTTTLGRDMELIELLDHLGYDEAWIGEHHSGGFEIIASPELFIAAAAERTRHIKLGTGVVSVPYHQPMMVADRMTQLDHMTRGRAMLGVGPGALVSDAMMFGVKTVDQRRRVRESIEAIMRLLRGETITMETDWFVLRNARLQLPPYSDPHVEVVISSSRTPVAGLLAGQWGLGMVSISGTSDPALQALFDNWRLAEQTAARHGQRMDRSRLRICSLMHIAETREKAFENVKFGLDAWCRYLAEAGTFAIVPPNISDPANFLVENGLAAIGTPDDAIRHIERIYRIGEFGAHLILANDWADWEQTKRSYELIARYVMPHFNDGFRVRRAVYDFNLQNRDVQLAALEEGIRLTNEQHEQHRMSGNPLPPVDVTLEAAKKKDA